MKTVGSKMPGCPLLRDLSGSEQPSLCLGASTRPHTLHQGPYCGSLILLKTAVNWALGLSTCGWWYFPGWGDVDVRNETLAERERHVVTITRLRI